MHCKGRTSFFVHVTTGGLVACSLDEQEAQLRQPIVLPGIAKASMLMMAIPNVEIVAVRLFTVLFNLCARWHQRRWFNNDRV